jgi:hypothetical protein
MGIDINALLAREGPPEGQVEAEATRLAEAKVLMAEASWVAADLNTLIDALCLRGFEVTVTVDEQTIIRGGSPHVPRISLTAKRVFGGH